MSNRLGALLQGLDHRLVGDADASVDDVTADSRKVGPGSVFVAVRGGRVDGHDFVPSAVGSGARAVVVDAAGAIGLELPEGITRVVVEDPREALGHMVRRRFDHPDRALTVVAVTGTNGKTTVSHLVRDLLTHTGRRCGLIGTIRYDVLDREIAAPLTTPAPEELLPLLAKIRDHGGDAVSMEASSHALDQRRLAGIEVDVAAFTNLSHEHLDYHGDLESYFAAKRRLLDHLDQPGREKATGRAVVYVDDPFLGAREWPEDAIRVGTGDGCRVSARSIRCGADGIVLDVELDGVEQRLSSGLLGAYNAANLLVVAGIGTALGLGPADLAAAFPALRPVPGRLEPVELEGGPQVLIDYAHTPEGMRSTLDTVRSIADGRLFVVFGCGGDRDRAKRPAMASIAVERADRVVLTLDNPRTEDPARIFADAEPGFAAAPDRARRIDDRAEAVASVLNEAGPADTIVICGKGHETYQILGTEKIPWDDRAVLLDAWREIGGAR